MAPEAKYANKKLLRSAGVEEPINLLEEGRFISDFPGLMIYIGRKNGNTVKDVIVYELNDDGSVHRNIRARRGEIEPDNEKRTLTVKLYNGSIEMPDSDDPHDVTKTQYTPFESVRLPPLEFDEMLKSDKVRRKRSYMKMSQLIDGIRNVDRDFPQISPLKRRVEKTRLVIEANRRVSTAIGCFTFMLIGIPLGVKSHRKETSIGMVMSLGIVFAYYIFIVVAKALADYPDLHPNLILWLPMLGLQFLGVHLIRRSS